jgi:membrane dipeptidase
MLICDTHADTLWRLAQQPAPSPHTLDITHDRLAGGGHTRVQALALFVGSNGLTGIDRDLIPRELAALGMLRRQGFRQIARLSEALPGHANVFLTIEGGEAFGEDPSAVEAYARQGVLAAAIVWNNENRLAHPAAGGSREGLTPFGRTIVGEMHRLHMALDISHLNERGSDEIMDAPVPCMASHSCARSLCDHPRNLTDEQLKKLFAAGGFVGVNFYVPFLTDRGRATADTVIDHMAHMCALGGEEHVGLGSDFDGIDQYPEGLRHAGDVPDLLERMLQRGFSDALVKRIAGENVAAYLDRV